MRQRRFAQISPTNLPSTAIQGASMILGNNPALNAAGTAVNVANDALQPGDMGAPKTLAGARAMGPMYLNLQSMYALGAQYGMGEEEVKAFSDTLLHNGLQIPEQSELFSKLQDMVPQLGGNFRDVLSIVMRVAIQSRAAAPADKVNRILQVLKELSHEYQQNPNFNIVKMFADASRGDIQALPILSWIGAFTAAMKHGRSLNEYYTKMNGIVTEVFSPAHKRLTIENKKAAMFEKWQRMKFTFDEAAAKLLWEKVYEPNFEMLSEIYNSWAKNPEEAFTFLGLDGMAAVQMLSKNILIFGAKISVFNDMFGLSRSSPDLRPQASTYVNREVVAQTRQEVRKEENKFEDYNENSKKAFEGAAETGSAAGNPYIKPGTTQEQAQKDSFGVPNNAFQTMVRLNGALAMQLQRMNELESNLGLMQNPPGGWIYRVIEGNLKPLQAAMATESGMKVGGGTGELSQINNVTLLTPQMITQTVAKCGALIEKTFDEIKEYGHILSMFVDESRRLLNPSTHQQEMAQLNLVLRHFDANSKLLQTELEKSKQQLVDYATVLPTLVRVTRLEEQISMFENLSAQIKVNTGSDLIGQFGMTRYRNMTQDGQYKTVVGPAPSQALIVLYMRVVMEFRNAISKIQSVLGTGQMDKSISNALIQRRKQLVSKIEGVKAKYTQIIAATMGNVAGGAPASLEKQVRLTGRVVNERIANIKEQEADRIADEIIRKYFDDLLPGYGTVLEHPDKHRHETVKEVEEHTRKHKHKSHRHEPKDD